MEERFKFRELEIILKDGNAVRTREPGFLCINERRILIKCDRICTKAFQCHFIPINMICHIGFDEAND